MRAVLGVFDLRKVSMNIKLDSALDARAFYPEFTPDNIVE